MGLGEQEGYAEGGETAVSGDVGVGAAVGCSGGQADVFGASTVV